MEGQNRVWIRLNILPAEYETAPTIPGVLIVQPAAKFVI
jgi:hypothetical protein